MQFRSKEDQVMPFSMRKVALGGDLCVKSVGTGTSSQQN